MLCTGLKIVLRDRLNINCTEMSKADTKQVWNYFHVILISYKTDNKFKENTRELN